MYTLMTNQYLIYCMLSSMAVNSLHQVHDITEWLSSRTCIFERSEWGSVKGPNFSSIFAHICWTVSSYISKHKSRNCNKNILVSPPGSDSLWSGLMFCCRCFWIFFCQRRISEMRRLIGVKFCTLISTRPNFIMPVQNFGEPTPKKI